MHKIIALDTETTGISSAAHRIIEIGCVTILDRQVTDSVYHHYLNPEREVDPGAVRVHGLTNAFLIDKPKIANIIDEFLEYIKGAVLLIHNAKFDMGFLNAELARMGRDKLDNVVIDSLQLAREMYPGKRNSLDHLCQRLGIDNTSRNLHGALLDAQLLSRVYLKMTAGQCELQFSDSGNKFSSVISRYQSGNNDLPVIRATEVELKEHLDILSSLKT